MENEKKEQAPQNHPQNGVCQHTVEIHTMPQCEFCAATKEFLKKNNMEYTEHTVSATPQSEQLEQKNTISVLKADVGSIGGHTKPSKEMISLVKSKLEEARPMLFDFQVNYTGDDIALIMSHAEGAGSEKIHMLAWDCFMEATKLARAEGLYAAGQDLLVDAPSGNIRGAGPAVAEIEFPTLPHYRPAEAFLVFAADKCSPGAYNLSLWNTFCNPMKNGGLLLSPQLAEGFRVTVIDMGYQSEKNDRIIELMLPEEHLALATLLRDTDRFAIEAIYSRAYPKEQIVSVSATRLHNIAGAYTGKDDPVMIVRTQGIFPAPEEVVAPFSVCPFVSGDCRGSHTMTLMPVAVNTPVRGEYCQPIVSALAFSLNEEGRFKNVDIFAGIEWDRARDKALMKSEMMREQGFFGVAMASQEELAYTGMKEQMKKLEERFVFR